MARGVPDGWHSVTPRLVVYDTAKLVEFLRKAFGATGDLRTARPSVLRIGDSNVMVSGVGPRKAMPSFLQHPSRNVNYKRDLVVGGPQTGRKLRAT